MFIRTILYLLIAVLLISFLRQIIGVITRGFAELMRGGGPQPGSASGGPPKAQAIGELKRDPVCGTYVATASSVRETVGGKVIYFCSAECRDKFLSSPR
jgi:YHS domain-containing protein